MSHSANLWDTAEFVVCIHKLEVGHPPGSPFFMLLYNLVSQFASSPRQVAMLCNATSAILSGFTIFFLYLSIVHIVRRLLAPGVRKGILSNGQKVEPMSFAKGVGILFAGFGGALLYAFTDTFWYSAIEAEVYAFSSLFTALVFWMMLEWEERSDNPNSDRWLILIAYCFGLSIGVHLLNLLCLPAMVLVFYFRKSKTPSFRGALLSVLGSFALIGLLMFGVIQGSMKVASQFDLFTVNLLGWRFNSGLICYCLLLLLLFIGSIYQMHKKGVTPLVRILVFATLILIGVPFISSSEFVWILLLIALGWFLFRYKKLTLRFVYGIELCAFALVMGFATYGVIAIRSSALPPMNENTPSTPFTLKKYLNREQYGSTPLLSGQSFASKVIDIKERKGEWIPAPKLKEGDTDSYVRGPIERDYTYDHTMLFPRVYSTSPQHIQAYNLWMNRKADDYSQPSFAENLKFFFAYQLNYMYWRYFGWNFIGRQNDLQGFGGILKGGVSTGFDFLDQFSYGKAKYYPDEMTQNKGHNVYYLMPLILGLLGILFQFTKGGRGMQSFWIVFFFFFMTGIAIILYINQTPFQPRERDYAYAGSFYAFAIWIGIGIAGIWDWISNKKKGFEGLATTIVGIIALAVPLQMLSQNYDDHDRSKRTVAADMGYNYLMSCEKDAIVFCYGDNDTFPLWYAQEIEGIKRDVRACNLSYLAADWYVDQMRQQAYESAPLPFTLMKPSFYYPTLFANVVEGGPMDLGEALDRIPETTYQGQYILPSNQLYLSLDTLTLQKKFPTIKPEVSTMKIDLTGKSILARDGLAVLDMIRSNQWQRSIYWLKTTPTNVFNNLGDYLASSGTAWKLYPTKMENRTDSILIDHEYDLVMNKFRWFGASKENNYFDDNIRNSIVSLYRGQLIPSLSLHLLDRGDRKKAIDVLKKCFQELPNSNIPYGYADLNLATAAYRAGLMKEGDTIVKELVTSCIKGLEWFQHLSLHLQSRLLAEGEVERYMTYAVDALKVANEGGRFTQFKTESEYVSNILARFYGVNVPQKTSK